MSSLLRTSAPRGPRFWPLSYTGECSAPRSVAGTKQVLGKYFLIWIKMCKIIEPGSNRTEIPTDVWLYPKALKHCLLNLWNSMEDKLIMLSLFVLRFWNYQTLGTCSRIHNYQLSWAESSFLYFLACCPIVFPGLLFNPIQFPLLISWSYLAWRHPPNTIAF
jgi:hypothetical protein